MKDSVEIMTCDTVNYLRIDDVIEMLLSSDEDRRQIIFNLTMMNRIDTVAPSAHAGTH